MKIRIQGNSLRIRLSKTEVEILCRDGFLEEHTSFGNSSFFYSVEESGLMSSLSASFSENKMTMLVPATFLEDWPVNDIVGFDAHMPVSENQSLYLLLEKDFKCLDNTTEDQSDHYENPKTTC